VETRDVLQELARRHGFVIDEARRAFCAPTDGVVVRTPLVLPIAAECRDVADFLAALPNRLPSRLVVLLQAGAAALGLWAGEDLIVHKCTKRYVKRGSGRAQPTYLKSRGKSRYGSRLRLQNARRLLGGIHDRLTEWIGTHGEPEQLFYACPVRLWSDLWHAPTTAPLERERFRKIPLSTRIPCFEELERIEATMRNGRVEVHEPDDPEIDKVDCTR
jgi:hypothetical protein